MGVEGGPGVPTGVDVHPASKGCTLSTSRPPTLASSRGGGAEVAGERCHTEGGALPGAVHQQTLFSDQEGWILSTCSKPQAFEPVHCQGSLQDGRNQHAEGPAVGERLDGLHRSEGCLPLGGSDSGAQEIPPLCLGRTDVRIPVSPLRVEQRPESVHQAPEAHSESSQTSRNSPCDIPGRYASPCPVKGGLGDSDGPNSPDVQSIGVFNQPREVTAEPNTADPISGVSDRLPAHDDPAHSGEGSNVDKDLQEDPTAGESVDTRSGQAYRENDSYHSSNLSGTTKIPRLAEAKDPVSTQGAVLRGHSQSRPRCPEGVRLVDSFNGFSEWEEYFDSGTRFDNGVRCLPAGMGCSVRWHTHRWPLVSCGEVGSYQLPRTDSCYVCSEGPLPRQEQLPHSLRMDNRTAVAYVNHMGGTRSPQLNSVATQLWTWCLERGIMLSAEYLPGVDNRIADMESRTVQSSAEWQLRRDIFLSLMQEICQCDVDLFASRLNHQLPLFISWRPDPSAMGTDALQTPWIRWKGYAFPPFALISKVLRKVREEGSTILLIAPVWESQPWYPTLLSMLVDFPTLLPTHSDLLTDPFGQHHPLAQSGQLQLAAWTLSGRDTQQKAFQQKLLSYCSQDGARAPTPLIRVAGGNGSAGVCHGKWIPFRALSIHSWTS